MALDCIWIAWRRCIDGVAQEFRAWKRTALGKKDWCIIRLLGVRCLCTGSLGVAYHIGEECVGGYDAVTSLSARE